MSKCGGLLSIMMALGMTGCVCHETAPITQRVAVLGNSITFHARAPQIGWDCEWGMAASSEDKDFCHVLLRHFTEANQGVAPQMLIENVANFEREHTTIELDAIDSIAKCVAMKPEIFVLAIGENVPNLDTEESRNLFRDKVIALLKRIQEGSHPMIVVRSSFWPRECIDVPLKQACETVGGVYVDIHELSVEENFARSERQIQHEGVAAHPGDRGMKAIADAIWKAIQEQMAAQKCGRSCR